MEKLIEKFLSFEILLAIINFMLFVSPMPVGPRSFS